MCATNGKPDPKSALWVNCIKVSLSLKSKTKNIASCSFAVGVLLSVSVNVMGIPGSPENAGFNVTRNKNIAKNNTNIDLLIFIGILHQLNLAIIQFNYWKLKY